MMDRMERLEQMVLSMQTTGGRQAAVHAQVRDGMDYVHLAGPTPAEAAVAAGQPQQRQAARNDKSTKKAAARMAGAGAWTTVVGRGGTTSRPQTRSCRWRGGRPAE